MQTVTTDGVSESKGVKVGFHALMRQQGESDHFLLWKLPLPGVGDLVHITSGPSKRKGWYRVKEIIWKPDFNIVFIQVEMFSRT